MRYGNEVVGCGGKEGLEMEGLSLSRECVRYHEVSFGSNYLVVSIIIVQHTCIWPTVPRITPKFRMQTEVVQQPPYECLPFLLLRSWLECRLLMLSPMDCHFASADCHQQPHCRSSQLVPLPKPSDRLVSTLSHFSIP